MHSVHDVCVCGSVCAGSVGSPDQGYAAADSATGAAWCHPAGRIITAATTPSSVPAPTLAPAFTTTPAQPLPPHVVSESVSSASGFVPQRLECGGLGNTAAGTSTNTATTSTTARVLAAVGASSASADPPGHAQGHGLQGQGQGQSQQTDTETDRSRSPCNTSRTASQRRQGDDLDPRIRIPFQEITFFKVG